MLGLRRSRQRLSSEAIVLPTSFVSFGDTTRMSCSGQGATSASSAGSCMGRLRHCFAKPFKLCQQQFRCFWPDTQNREGKGEVVNGLLQCEARGLRLLTLRYT
ncbi:hypothetical protein K525DRAFT_271351 [Schizophyllum commune Loenen D]|nr:hypothetical protein K525DRAFT_271351 [Schizophyllum commune Loenen D]